MQRCVVPPPEPVLGRSGGPRAGGFIDLLLVVENRQVHKSNFVAPRRRSAAFGLRPPGARPLGHLAFACLPRGSGWEPAACAFVPPRPFRDCQQPLLNEPGSPCVTLDRSPLQPASPEWCLSHWLHPRSASVTGGTGGGAVDKIWEFFFFFVVAFTVFSPSFCLLLFFFFSPHALILYFLVSTCCAWLPMVVRRLLSLGMGSGFNWSGGGGCAFPSHRLVLALLAFRERGLSCRLGAGICMATTGGD